MFCLALCNQTITELLIQCSILCMWLYGNRYATYTRYGGRVFLTVTENVDQPSSFDVLINQYARGESRIERIAAWESQRLRITIL